MHRMHRHIFVGKSHHDLISVLECYEDVSEHMDKGYPVAKDKKEKINPVKKYKLLGEMPFYRQKSAERTESIG